MTRPTFLAALALMLAVPAYAQQPGEPSRHQDIIPKTMEDRVVFHAKLAGVATACSVEWREMQGALIGFSMKIGFQQRQVAFIDALFDEMRKNTARTITREDCATLRPNALRNEVVAATNRLMHAPPQ
jgi:hypothetical protein